MTHLQGQTFPHVPRTFTVDADSGDVLIPLPMLATEFNRNRRTIARWLKDESLGLPPPVRIRGRLFFFKSALDEWKRTRVLEALPAKVA